MSAVKKIIRILLVAVASVIGIVVLAIVVFLKWPQVLLNENNLRRMAPLASYVGIFVQWNESQISIESKSLFQKKIGMDFTDFCLERSDPHQSACFDHISLSAEFLLSLKGFKIPSLGPIYLTGGDILLNINESKDKKGFALNVPKLVLPSFLRETHFDQIAIIIDRLKLIQKEPIVSGSLFLHVPTEQEGHPQSLNLNILTHEGFGFRMGVLDADLQSPSQFLENDWTLKGKVKLEQTKKNIAGEFEIHPNDLKIYSFDIHSDVYFDQLKTKMDLNGTIGEGKLDLNLNGDLHPPQKTIKNIIFSQCNLNIAQDDSEDRAKILLECPIDVEIAYLAPPSYEWSHRMVPTRLGLLVKIDAESSFFPALNQKFSGTADLSLKSVSPNPIKTVGSANLKFSGIPDQYPQNWDLVGSSDLSIQVPQFEKLVEFLQSTALAIFAPINALKGTVTMDLKGNVDVAKNQGKVPVQFKTQLKSEGQSLETEGKGELQFQITGFPKMNFDLELTLNDFQILLPPLGPSGIPQFLPDGRFKNRKRSPQKANPQITYKIKLVSASSKPAKLVFHDSKNALPIILDLLAENGKIGGSVNLDKTKLELFRRRANVEKFEIALRHPAEMSVINGDLLVDYADYQIHILVLGTVKRPRVILESDPPLDEEQILSVLIYGRTFDELDEEAKNSVEGVSGAVADRALTLASLSLLASTPIQSISYNPTSGQFSATFRVAKKTSISVGSREGKTQEVGFRRNIYGNWIFNTTVENDPDEGKQRSRALIEWYKRH